MNVSRWLEEWVTIPEVLMLILDSHINSHLTWFLVPTLRDDSSLILSLSFSFFLSFIDSHPSIFILLFITTIIHRTLSSLVIIVLLLLCCCVLWCNMYSSSFSLLVHSCCQLVKNSVDSNFLSSAAHSAYTVLRGQLWSAIDGEINLSQTDVYRQVSYVFTLYHHHLSLYDSLLFLTSSLSNFPSSFIFHLHSSYFKINKKKGSNSLICDFSQLSTDFDVNPFIEPSSSFPFSHRHHSSTFPFFFFFFSFHTLLSRFLALFSLPFWCYILPSV